MAGRLEKVREPGARRKKMFPPVLTMNKKADNQPKYEILVYFVFIAAFGTSITTFARVNTFNQVITILESISSLAKKVHTLFNASEIQSTER